MRRDGSCKMTAMHFTAIADTLREVRPLHHTGRNGIALEWRRTVAKFADLCARSNDRFDRHRFMVACGMEDA